MLEKQILRLKDVVELVGLSKTTIWRRMRAGEFPPAIRLGGPSTRAVGWKMTDVEAWLEQRRASYTISLGWGHKVCWKKLDVVFNPAPSGK